MKAFEAWLKTQESEYMDTNDIGIEDAMAKKTWKAALEWVLSKVEHANSDGSIIIEIKQELNK